MSESSLTADQAEYLEALDNLQRLGVCAVADDFVAIDRAWHAMTGADRADLLDREMARGLDRALGSVGEALRDLLWDGEHGVTLSARATADGRADAIALHVLRLNRPRRLTGRAQVGWAFHTPHDPAPHERGSLFYDRAASCWTVRVGRWTWSTP